MTITNSYAVIKHLSYNAIIKEEELIYGKEGIRLKGRKAKPRKFKHDKPVYEAKKW